MHDKSGGLEPSSFTPPKLKSAAGETFILSSGVEAPRVDYKSAKLYAALTECVRRSEAIPQVNKKPCRMLMVWWDGFMSALQQMRLPSHPTSLKML